MTGSWGSLDVSNLWVSEVGNSVLLSTSSHGGVFWLNDSLDDLNGFTSSAMSSSHFTVHLGDGSAKGDISVLLVHVYDTSSSKISKHDSVVLDRVGFFLEDLTNRDDLTLGSSNLVLSLHLIPELRSCDNNVLCEDSNSIASWLWNCFRWSRSSNNPVLLNLKSLMITISLTFFCMDATPTPLTIVAL